MGIVVLRGQPRICLWALFFHVVILGLVVGLVVLCAVHSRIDPWSWLFYVVIQGLVLAVVVLRGHYMIDPWEWLFYVVILGLIRGHRCSTWSF